MKEKNGCGQIEKQSISMGKRAAFFFYLFFDSSSTRISIFISSLDFRVSAEAVARDTNTTKTRTFR